MNYGPDDLVANREGRISAPQYHRLWRQDLAVLAISALAVVGGATVLVLQLSGTLVVHARGAGIGFGAIVGGLLFGFFVGRGARDLVAGRVYSVQGPLSKDMSVGRSRAYWLLVGGMKFYVDGKTYTAVGEGERTLYYLPRSKTLLSIE